MLSILKMQNKVLGYISPRRFCYCNAYCWSSPFLDAWLRTESRAMCGAEPRGNTEKGCLFKSTSNTAESWFCQIRIYIWKWSPGVVLVLLLSKISGWLLRFPFVQCLRQSLKRRDGCARPSSASRERIISVTQMWGYRVLLSFSAITVTLLL